MSWIKFFFSKVFWKNIFIMLIVTGLGLVGLYFYLLRYTQHGKTYPVPEVYGLKPGEAEKILKKNKMRMVIIDTLDYDPDLPKFAIREQNPKAKTFVKEGRKIYVKLNAGAYRKVKLPKLRGLTLRQAKATLQSMGLIVGKVKEEPYFAEVVLDVLKGKDTLRAGEELPVKTVINLIVGSGETEFQIDTLAKDSIPAEMLMMGGIEDSEE
jgi:beta-lactam-binding protein with PASTA domain